MEKEEGHQDNVDFVYSSLRKCFNEVKEGLSKKGVAPLLIYGHMMATMCMAIVDNLCRAEQKEEDLERVFNEMRAAFISLKQQDKNANPS